MVPTEVENPVSCKLQSSVVPARVTGEEKDHELTNMDLAIKLHYLRGLYFFKSDAAQGLDTYDLKKPMFPLLDLYFQTSGRIRRSENGRPFIKCNDGGVRIIEAHSNRAIDEWLAMNDSSLDDQLVHNHVLGPDLGFSPLVFIQFTWFKCGGISVGLSWAHVLGDAFSASDFINMWGQIMAGHLPPKSLRMPNTVNYQFPSSDSKKPFSFKMVEPIGDHWIITNNCKMGTHSFHVTAKQLNHLLSKICDPIHTAKFSPFEILSAIVWISLCKLKGESEPKVVTVCRNDSRGRGIEIPSNSQVIGTVAADFAVEKTGVLELAKIIAEKMLDERSIIEEFLERENGNSDLVIYGTNLTFVNLEEAKIYGLELKGHKPVFANYNIAGVGDEGVVVVLPGPENGKDGVGGGGSRGGRTVTLTLPEYQLAELKNELKEEWGIF